jgi:5,10-methylenetetrahydrofolate reductase
MLEGVGELHFYTLNRAAVVAQTCENLGIIPTEATVVD